MGVLNYTMSANQVLAYVVVTTHDGTFERSKVLREWPGVGLDGTLRFSELDDSIWAYRPDEWTAFQVVKLTESTL